MTVGAIVQARMSSKRFPNKTLGRLGGHSLVEIIHHRLSKSMLLDSIVFAIPDEREDDELYSHLVGIDAKVYRGSRDDVQLRFIEAARVFQIDVIVRITADCPLIDWKLLDEGIEIFLKSNVDYLSNTINPTYPDGLDFEVFAAVTLSQVRQAMDSKLGREHVTWNMKNIDGLTKLNLESQVNYSSLRWTVDYKKDLESIERTLPMDFMDLEFEELIRSGFGGSSVIAQRNEGSMLGTGQKLWKRAKEIIPGGSMLLSKRSEMFLPEFWPAYFSKAKGISVWDLDGNEFLDFSLMGIGACSLGYGDDAVDEAVLLAVKQGVASTLNSPIEVELAERLIEIHPWAGKVRFTRSGGEANAVAIRIARATTGRDKVALCGYHGWHDWYLSANLSDEDALDRHLLPGLETGGVPRVLAGTVNTFAFNDIDRLDQLLQTQEYACVIMEVERNIPPDVNFLSKAKELAHKYGSLLIFDECTSGFRETFGGLHLKYGVTPDIAMFGKAIGNGYAIAAVVGSQESMEGANESFISSTFWTERIGPAAALASIRRIEETQSWKTNPLMGAYVKQRWSEILGGSEYTFSIFGLDSMPSFKINRPDWDMCRTYITQSMLDKGYLSGPTFYPSLGHNTQNVSRYLSVLEEILIGVDKLDTKELEKKLKGPVAHSGFQRLN